MLKLSSQTSCWFASHAWPCFWRIAVALVWRMYSYIDTHAFGRNVLCGAAGDVLLCAMFVGLGGRGVGRCARHRSKAIVNQRAVDRRCAGVCHAPKDLEFSPSRRRLRRLRRLKQPER